MWTSWGESSQLQSEDTTLSCAYKSVCLYLPVFISEHDMSKQKEQEKKNIPLEN